MSENAKSHQFFIEIGGSLWSHFLSESLQIWLRQLLEIDLQPCGEQGNKLQGIMFQGDLQSLLGMELQHCQGRSLLTTLSKLESDTDREAQRPDK